MANTEKKILLCTIGSAGDVYPFIMVGQELKKRGFHVTLMTSQYFEAHAHSAGLEFLGLGKVEDYHMMINNPDLWDAEKGFKFFAENVVFPIMRPAYELISRFDPTKTILIAQGQFFAAHIAHDKLNFPFITVHLQPAVIRSSYEFPLMPAWMHPFLKRRLFNLIDILVFDKLFAAEINLFRKSLGLAPIKKVFDRWMHSPQMNLGFFPDWFARPQPDWPPQTHLTGFVYYDQQENIPADVDEFLNAGSAPIIFTPGTAMKHGKQFFLDCIKACQRLGHRGILLTQFPEQLPAQLPPGLQHFAYLPFHQIFPRVLALVHHGGIGTTAQAIAAGIPQVIRPLAHDQPDTAARIEKLGIGIALSPKQFSAAALVEKLNLLITSQQILDRCQMYAQKIDSVESLNRACTLIEDFAHQKLIE